MRIILSLPPAQLSPNARCHWRVKAKHTKAYRVAAMIAALNAPETRHRWNEAQVEARFYFKQNRRRDRDNCLSSLKSAFDGLKDAGVIADDSGLIHLPVVIGVDKENPRVELWIEPTKGAA